MPPHHHQSSPTPQSNTVDAAIACSTGLSYDSRMKRRHGHRHGSTSISTHRRSTTKPAAAASSPSNSKKNIMVASLSVTILLLAVAVAVAAGHFPLRFLGLVERQHGVEDVVARNTRADVPAHDHPNHPVARLHRQYYVLNKLHHSPQAFCQGLQWHDSKLVESTGMYGQSQVRKWDPFQEDVQVHDLDPSYFGEGLTWFQDAQGQDRYIQLTWREQTALIYDTNLQLVEKKAFQTTTEEGWGITFDPKQQLFYVSDGSDTILVWNLDLEEIRRFQVSVQLPHSQQPQKLKMLNELEWNPNDDTIWAHVWFQNAMVKVHTSGRVLEIVDLTNLFPVEERRAFTDNPEAVMNGIAHYQLNQWWITGKYWPYIYLIDLDTFDGDENVLE